MDFTIFSQINYGAVAAASVLFFVLGAVWFSGLFSALWVQELKRHNVYIQEPTTAVLCTKLILTFSSNVVASLAIALLVIMTGSNTIISGLFLGVVITVGCSATTLASVFVWENRSVKLFLIDIGYPAVGSIAAAILLSVWR